MEKLTSIIFIEDEGWAIKTRPYLNNPFMGISFWTTPDKEEAQKKADEEHDIITRAIKKSKSKKK